MTEVSSDDQEQLAHMLAAGRVDLWAGSRFQAQFVADQAGIPPVEEVYSFGEQTFNIACNPDTDPDTLEALQAALDEMEADGTADAIRESYL